MNQYSDLVAERGARVAQLTAAAKSLELIAHDIGVTKRSVSRYRERLKTFVKPRQPAFTPEQDARIVDMLDDGCPYAEIARTLGISWYRIQRRYPNQSKWEPIGLYHAKMAAALGLSINA